MTLLLSTSLPLRLPSSCTLLQRQSIRTFYCSNIDFEKKKEPSKKYSNTLLLPKTPFPMKVEGKRRIARDKEIFQHCNLDKQYAWQRENRYYWAKIEESGRSYDLCRTGTEYVLHDGPPYANGSPHLGHAVNKILKDITGRWERTHHIVILLFRFQSSRGCRLHWVPGGLGWDRWSVAFNRLFWQVGTAMVFLLNSKQSKEGKDWRQAR